MFTKTAIIYIFKCVKLYMGVSKPCLNIFCQTSIFTVKNSTPLTLCTILQSSSEEISSVIGNCTPNLHNSTDIHVKIAIFGILNKLEWNSGISSINWEK